MGMAGQAMKLLSDVVPVVGGLASFAAAALKAGDHRMQTRRVVRVADLAPDAVECCSLARRLALRVTDGLAAGTISTTETSVGGRGWNLGIGALPDGTSEEAVMEWFTDELADREASNTASRGTPEEEAGRRLGKQHLKRLLVAMGRDCLQDTNTTEEKVEKLLEVIVGGSCSRVTKMPSADGQPIVESPAVSAASHDGSLDREAELAVLKAKLEAMELADERRQEKLEAIELADERRKTKLEALELADEKRQAEFEALQSDNKTLLGEVDAMKKLIPKPQGGESSYVDVGGGQVLAQRQEMKTKEDFWQEAENTAASAAAAVATNDHPVTHDQLREFAALQDERHRGHEDRHRELAATQGRFQRTLTSLKNKRRWRK
ncbi:unnamed protein product [Ectocarpus fasciculatus]